MPYKEKDKVYKEYHEVLDQLYQKLNISINRRRLDNFKNALKNVAKRGEDALDNERAKLMHRYDQLKQEIQTYENNIGFLNVSSKKKTELLLRETKQLPTRKVPPLSRKRNSTMPEKNSTSSLSRKIQIWRKLKNS